MAKVTVFTSLTLDGVLQAPGRPDEDFLSWPHQTGNPFTEALDSTRKYIASTTLREPLPWRNSTP